MGSSASFTHQASVLGAVATFPRLGLLFGASLCPYPLLNFFIPASDIFHASHQLSHPPRKARLTSTIYDMTTWLMPELHVTGNLKSSGRNAERLFRNADGLIAISKCTRDDAVRLLGLAPEKIEGIYPGIASAFFQASPEMADDNNSASRPHNPYLTNELDDPRRSDLGEQRVPQEEKTRQLPDAIHT